MVVNVTTYIQVAMYCCSPDLDAKVLGPKIENYYLKTFKRAG